MHLRLSLLEAELIELLKVALEVFIQYTIICASFYILKYILRQNERIDGTLKRLTAKTLEQAITFEELKDAYGKLEDITILKERNRLAREIHDTLGHTLTTVLVETEAGKILLQKDKELGIEKIELAQEQIRKGLDDLRRSVSLLSQGDELLDFNTSLEVFIKDTVKHTGVLIKYDINLDVQLNSPIRRTLFRALQEGITNGIKHGKSSVFVFK
jgi:signal transduction histidine kinase